MKMRVDTEYEISSNNFRTLDRECGIELVFYRIEKHNFLGVGECLHQMLCCVLSVTRLTCALSVSKWRPLLYANASRARRHPRNHLPHNSQVTRMT